MREDERSTQQLRKRKEGGFRSTAAAFLPSFVRFRASTSDFFGRECFVRIEKDGREEGDGCKRERAKKGEGDELEPGELLSILSPPFLRRRRLSSEKKAAGWDRKGKGEREGGVELEAGGGGGGGYERSWSLLLLSRLCLSEWKQLSSHAAESREEGDGERGEREKGREVEERRSFASTKQNSGITTGILIP